MRFPKVGDKVKAVKLDDSHGYLTEGNVYTVIGKWGSDVTFTVLDDNAEPTNCRYPSCAHGYWELCK